MGWLIPVAKVIDCTVVLCISKDSTHVMALVMIYPAGIRHVSLIRRSTPTCFSVVHA